jgi:hypothetical protein
MVFLTHEPAAELLVVQLQPWADQMATRFGRPVYLVGSSLRMADPRDVDVRVVVSDEEFRARYGDPVAWGEALWWPNRNDGSIRYCMDVGDLSREASIQLRLNIDFQVQPPSEARRHLCAEGSNKIDLGPNRRRRLDTSLHPEVMLFLRERP